MHARISAQHHTIDMAHEIRDRVQGGLCACVHCGQNQENIREKRKIFYFAVFSYLVLFFCFCIQTHL